MHFGNCLRLALLGIGRGGDKCSFALTESGKLFTWGSKMLRPKMGMVEATMGVQWYSMIIIHQNRGTPNLIYLVISSPILKSIMGQ